MSREEWLKKKQELEEEMTKITKALETSQKLVYTEYLGRKIPEYVGNLTAEEEKKLREEYDRLYREYTTLLLNEVADRILKFKPVVFYQCLDKQLGLVYDNGKWWLFTLEDPIYLGKHPRDCRLIVEDNMPKEYRERSFIARIGQGELVYPIRLEEKPSIVEVIKEVKVPVEPEKPKEEPVKPSDTIDWLLQEVECKRCGIKLPRASFERYKGICPNCGYNKNLENKNTGPKKIDRHPIGFRSFLSKNKTAREKRVEDQFNKD